MPSSHSGSCQFVLVQLNPSFSSRSEPTHSDYSAAHSKSTVATRLSSRSLFLTGLKHCPQRTTLYAVPPALLPERTHAVQSHINVTAVLYSQKIEGSAEAVE